MTNERAVAPGWYADPMGRYEHRYFNGQAWTADVSINGTRLVDQLGLTPAPTSETARGSNGLAVASMVLGIVAISIAWMPFLVVVGAFTALLALVFAGFGFRRARSSGVGRPFAVVGAATGAGALLACVLGVMLTVVVLDAYDEYLHPPPSEITIGSCEVQGQRAVMSGVLRNTGDRVGDYTVVVGFVRADTDNTHRTVRVTIDDVEPGATAQFDAQSQIALAAIDCRIIDVNGPLPFGVALD